MARAMGRMPTTMEETEQQRREKLGEDDGCKDDEEEWDELAKLGADVVASFVSEFVAALVVVAVASLGVVAASGCVVAACAGSSVASAWSWQVSEAHSHQGEKEGSLEHLTELVEPLEEGRLCWPAGKRSLTVCAA